MGRLLHTKWDCPEAIRNIGLEFNASITKTMYEGEKRLTAALRRNLPKRLRDLSIIELEERAARKHR